MSATARGRSGRSWASRARREAGQLSWWARGQLTRDVLPKRRLARRGILLPQLPARRRRLPGSVWAVSMVRDEADVIGATINHLLAQGIDHVLVADNLSSDETPAVLRALAAADPRIHLARDREPAYHQAEKMTRLAVAATRAGADWIVPFDADEFWFAEQHTVADHLRLLAHADPEVGVVRADWHHMVPTVAEPDDLHAAQWVLDSTPVTPGKVAMRAHRFATLHVGNHFAQRVGTHAEGLHIAHAAFRGPDQVARKLRQGAAAVMLTNPGDEIAPYWRGGASLDDAHIAQAWERVSRGESEPRIGIPAVGPMVTTMPLRWERWDPDGVVAAATRAHPTP